MARKKLSPLVQAMNIFGELDDRDQQTLADWIKSRTMTPRKAATKKSNKKAAPFGTEEDERETLRSQQFIARA